MSEKRRKKVQTWRQTLGDPPVEQRDTQPEERGGGAPSPPTLPLTVRAPPGTGLGAEFHLSRGINRDEHCQTLRSFCSTSASNFFFFRFRRWTLLFFFMSVHVRASSASRSLVSVGMSLCVRVRRQQFVAWVLRQIQYVCVVKQRPLMATGRNSCCICRPDVDGNETLMGSHVTTDVHVDCESA